MRARGAQVASALQFSRVPSDFEPYYLGRDSKDPTFRKESMGS